MTDISAALFAAIALAMLPVSERVRMVDDPALRFANIMLSTGVRLRYVEQGDPNGVPVILLHGYSDSWFSYSRVLPLLSPRYHVFALDQRGHGDSERPTIGYGMNEMARDVIAFMDAKDLERATIVGHSMGSFVAQQVALAAPERVSGMVLIGSATKPRTFNEIMDLKLIVESLSDPVPEDFVREFQVSTVHQPVPPGFIDHAVFESLKMPAYVWRGIMKGMLATETPVDLRNSNIPALVLWGDKDAYCPRSEQDALLALLPKGRLEIYEETGHALHWERPDEFVADFDAFMKR